MFHQKYGSYALISVAIALVIVPMASGANMPTLLAGVGLAATITTAYLAERCGRLAQFALASCSLVFAATMCEVVLRAIGYGRETNYENIFEYDAVLGWKFIPGAQGEAVCSEYVQDISINKNGFRDVAWGLGDRPVVAFVGDSFVSNLGVALDECYTSIVREGVSPGYDVRNYGVNGYGQVQQYHVMRDMLESTNVRLVILSIYVRNDFDDNVARFDWTRGYRRPSARIFEGRLVLSSAPPRMVQSTNFVDDWVYNLLTYQGMRRLYSMARVAAGGRVDPSTVPPELRYCRRPLLKEERESVDVTLELLSMMHELCQQSGVELALMIAPSLVQASDVEWRRLVSANDDLEGNYERGSVSNLIARWASRRGIECLDLLPSLLEASGRGGTFYYEQEQHWNAQGNTLVASAVLEWLAKIL